MTPERWREVKDLFDRAMERPAGERGAMLEEERRRDPELASEAEQLVAANAAAGDFLEKPAVEQIVLPAESPRVPERIGPYEVERELGHGGMGTVYLASRSQDGFRQTVALKLVRRGMDSDFILRASGASARSWRASTTRRSRACSTAARPPTVCRTSSWSTFPGDICSTTRRRAPSPGRTASASSSRSARQWRTRTATSSCTGTSSRPTSWSRPTGSRSCSTSGSRSSCVRTRRPRRGGPRRRCAC